MYELNGVLSKNMWHCKKCKRWLGAHIDLDYHDNMEHANANDSYVASWIKRGRPGLSPYD